MKRIALFFAAIAALSSCMKENTLSPVQPVDGQVTIKAVAADTKTTLNGTDVVWENEDAIKLVFKGENYYTVEFTTELEENSSEAEFVGVLAPELTVDAYDDKGFAVYPASVEVESDGQIEFSIPANQTGLVATGSNLSYSEISLASLKSKGTANATFKNAVSLLKITVPQGVKSVVVASETPLAGTASFYFDAENATLAINEDKWYDPDRLYSVTLASAAETLNNAQAYYVHVFPGTHKNLTISVEGNECSYSKTVNAQYVFEASKYYGLNIANIFSIASGDFAVSPLGGDVEVPVVTTMDDYKVNIPADATWLSVKPATKGEFRKDIITLTTTENTTSATRNAVVTVTSGDKTLAEFTVTQKNYVKDLLGEYVETYSQYGQPFNGTLRIELSDDFSKGLYKVTICGTVLYADYENGKLNMYDGKYTRTLNVLSDFSKFEGSQFSIGYNTISDYRAVKPLGAPELTEAELAIVGTYNEVWTYNGNTVAPTANAMTIKASEEAAFGRLFVKFLNIDGYYTECYANLSTDGTKLVIESYGAIHGKYFSIQQPIEMTINLDGSLSFSSATMQGWKNVTDYVATKVIENEGGDDTGEGATLESLVGTWHQSFTAGGPYENDLMEIELSDDSSKGQLKVTMFVYSTYKLVCYANLSEDGTKLTVLSNGVDLLGMGTFSEDMVMTVSEGGKKIEYKKTINTSYQMPVGMLVAIKN